ESRLVDGELSVAAPRGRPVAQGAEADGGHGRARRRGAGGSAPRARRRLLRRALRARGRRATTDLASGRRGGARSPRARLAALASGALEVQRGFLVAQEAQEEDREDGEEDHCLLGGHRQTRELLVGEAREAP